MAQPGTGRRTYERVSDWPEMPKGETLGVVSRVATDSQDRVYVFQRKDPPVVVFDRDGNYLASWGTGAVAEGQFHLPHSIAIGADGKLYVADRANKRIQIFSPDGEVLGMWTGMGGPNDITLGKDGVFYIAEQENGDKPAYICVRDGDGNVLARLETRHVHGVGVDSRGDVYAGLTVDKSVDKFVRVS